jgi:hypothetical protein
VGILAAQDPNTTPEPTPEPTPELTPEPTPDMSGMMGLCFMSGMSDIGACKHQPMGSAGKSYYEMSPNEASPNEWILKFEANVTYIANNRYLISAGKYKFVKGSHLNSAAMFAACRPGTGQHSWKVEVTNGKWKVYCDDVMKQQGNRPGGIVVDNANCPFRVGAQSNSACTKMFTNAKVEVKNFMLEAVPTPAPTSAPTLAEFASCTVTSPGAVDASGGLCKWTNKGSEANKGYFTLLLDALPTSSWILRMRVNFIYVGSNHRVFGFFKRWVLKGKDLKNTDCKAGSGFHDWTFSRVGNKGYLSCDGVLVKKTTMKGSHMKLACPIVIGGMNNGQCNKVFSNAKLQVDSIRMEN